MIRRTKSIKTNRVFVMQKAHSRAMMTGGRISNHLESLLIMSPRKLKMLSREEIPPNRMKDRAVKIATSPTNCEVMFSVVAESSDEIILLSVSRIFWSLR